MCIDVYDSIVLILSITGGTDIDIDVIFGQRSLFVYVRHCTMVL